MNPKPMQPPNGRRGAMIPVVHLVAVGSQTALWHTSHSSSGADHLKQGGTPNPAEPLLLFRLLRPPMPGGSPSIHCLCAPVGGTAANWVCYHCGTSAAQTSLRVACDAADNRRAGQLCVLQPSRYHGPQPWHPRQPWSPREQWPKMSTVAKTVATNTVQRLRPRP